MNCYRWNIALNDGETWTLQKVDHNYLESFEIWCWRSMEKISGTDTVRTELQRLKVERNILQTIKRMKATWIGHILYRNCLFKHITEGKIGGGIGVIGRRCKQLLEDLKVKRGYWKLKEEALHLTLLQALLYLK